MITTIGGINTLDKVIMMGDKVLIRPQESNGVTRSGLFLPPTVQEKGDIERICHQNWTRISDSCGSRR
jgi:co-chaperonin GroES (HSP10)